MADTSITVSSYLVYLSLSILLTVWVGRTLHKNGRIFLVDSFLGNEQLADSINHLLLVGFYLINVGHISLTLRYGDKPHDSQQAIEFICSKVGFVMLILGFMHFANVYVFSRMRRRALLRNTPPPVRPQGQLGAQRM